MLGAVLEQARSADLGESGLALRFLDEDAAIAKQLEQDDVQALLREHASAIAGRPVEVRLLIGDEAPPEGAPARTAAPPPRRLSRANLIELARKDAPVKKLLRELGAQVIDIRPMPAGVPENDNLEDNG